MIEGEGADQERLKDRNAAHRFLNGYTDDKKRKGWNEMHPTSILDRDVKAQWALGNRGGDKEWK